MSSTQRTPDAADVAIVGAGPIGIEMAVALKRAGISYLHFDAKQIGFTISWFAPGTRFFSSNERIAIAGVPLQTSDQNKSTREQYLAYLRTVVELYDLQINTYEPVVNIERGAGDFLLTTHPGAGPRQYRVKRLILATGGTDRPRKLGCPGEHLPHVGYYFDDPHKYFRKRVLIIGGKNSAVEAALRCHHAGAKVSLSYRRAKLPHKSIKYWLMPEISGLIESGRMPTYFGTVPTRITGGAVELSRFVGPLTITEEDVHPLPFPQGQEPAPVVVEADFVLALIGYEADMKLLHMAGVELSGECEMPNFDPQTMQTNVPGIYVAGTAVAGTQDKYRVFIENCHVHVDRILAALTGSTPPPAPAPLARPES
jgi:thioredoxin reductase (NADPH)